MKLERQNQDAYDDLVTAIEDAKQQFNLLIPVCDDDGLRQEIIHAYQAELHPDWQCYSTILEAQRPSLSHAIATAIPAKANGFCLITVLGANQLHSLKLSKVESEQETFLNHLKHTHTAQPPVQHPIVLWLTPQLLGQVHGAIHHFENWEGSIFRFTSKKTTLVSGQDLVTLRKSVQDIAPIVRNLSSLPLQDLASLSQFVTAKSQDMSQLAKLYYQIGDIYFNRTESGEFQTYRIELEQAKRYYQQAIDWQTSLNLQAERSASLNQLARIHTRLGHYREAEISYQQALTLRQQIYGEAHPKVAQSLNNLALLYESQQRYHEAEPLLTKALILRQRFYGEAHPEVAESLNNLGLLYESQRRYYQAKLFYRRALSLAQDIWDTPHPDIASSLNNLAGLYCLQERMDEAEPLYQEALALRQELYGETHPSVAQSFNNLAVLYKVQGRYAEAELLLQKALALRRCLFGQVHPAIVSSLNNLASLYASQKQYSKAEPLYLEALSLAEQSLGANHPNVQAVLLNYQDLQDKLDQRLPN